MSLPVATTWSWKMVVVSVSVLTDSASPEQSTVVVSGSATVAAGLAAGSSRAAAAARRAVGLI